MPEGHTIHRLARRRARLLVGQHVSADSPQGRFEDGARLLDGRALGATDAWGKHLFHRYDDLWLYVHLGLYGKFRDGTLPAPPAVGALRLRLAAHGPVHGGGRGRIVTTLPEDRERPSGRPRRFDAYDVYGRAGLPCRVCRTPVLDAQIAARRLFWCPVCQA